MDETSVRLSKRMVELGLCSRREADACIEQGLVKVDGKVVNTLGARVRPEQEITLAGTPQALATLPVTLLLNRPAEDDTPPAQLLGPDSRSPQDASEQVWLARHRQQLTAIGAVDEWCHGLVVLTQDKKLPRHLAECEMEFLLQVARAPAADDLKARVAAIRLDGKPLRQCKISRQSDQQLRCVVYSPRAGFFDEIGRQLGVQLQGARCIRIGRLALSGLQPGEWRYLQAFERF
ncbi:S4 domain-containing protein [Chromobacterium sp. IIBBL 290-4]|uniref:S4 domain-containing protein n=1 Tax=Chromobacterium sp. IIBBL 290-4 TaxID=2953890 RepID=UPI0020B8ACCD|nr:RNA pseudouridine synthase [Chromobacterium sp. IIBBL 290-4]UTH75373.1 RNA pseudouridine synthase [Chromobacterium sp. IIBBL 290-4]